MAAADLRELAVQVESQVTLSAEAREQAAAALAQAGGATDRPDAATIESTDALLAVVQRILPGWTVALDGLAMAPNGHWRCTLRRSASRDDDEYVGVGHGPSLPHALLAATLKVLAVRP